MMNRGTLRLLLNRSEGTNEVRRGEVTLAHGGRSSKSSESS